MRETIEQAMRRALELAARGRGAVEPNPMVGCVVLDASGQIVGEGWHEKYGGPHAEVHAMAAAGNHARGGTLVVTLEPCCHHGKTAPCTDAVIAAGIRRVVCAMADPFPKVAGGGIAKLRDAGIVVDVGVMRAEAEALNAPYLMRVTQGRPWVIAKWAMSLDGKIATATGDSQWISGEESRALVHDLRGRVDSIVVGAETLRRDDPLLTARPAGPRTATRIVATTSGRLPTDCQLLCTIDQAPVIVWTTTGQGPDLAAWQAAGATILHANEVNHFLAELGGKGMTNVLVEGGGQLLGAFRDADRIDEVMVFIAPIIIGGRAPTPVVGEGVSILCEIPRLIGVTGTRFGSDWLIRGRIAR
jgi:diaminohydroxyphosphoribosylaminopyrimidine deaminase/5-amino-6-(5-phosphoribosylamino)uracil reductase